MTAKRALSRIRAPDEHEAQERAWAVVRLAYEEREAVATRRSRRSFVAAFAVAVAVGAAALSPAGATVGRLITHALGIQHAAPALSSLPAPGRLLISGPAGTWTVAADGSLRRLGPWRQASWSPHGLYVAATRGNQLVALEPHGITQWAISRPAVSDPRWYSPSGYRLAYLSAGDLRVVAGDGTADHLVATGVADVAPAWRPAHPYQLAYLTGRHQLALRDGDTRRLLWSTTARSSSTKLEWSTDGDYLLAISPTAVDVHSANGRLVFRITFPTPSTVIDAALSPNRRLLALVLGGISDQVVLASVLTRNPAPRRVPLAGPGLRQVVWSPDGSWLMVSWPAADQWVFVRVTGIPRITAVSHIAQQFSAGGADRTFPQLDGWCCSAARLPR